jgi:ketosteroid isomerase-like protein
MSTPTVEDRLRALEDERAILQVLYAYGHAIDYGAEEEFLDCWTDTALVTYNFDVADRHVPSERENMRFEGREQIAGFFQRHTHAPERYHKHWLVEPRIVIDGDRATVSSLYARLDETGNGPQLTSYGRYLDVAVRCPDGRWRLQERHGESESRVPMRDGR